MGYWTQVRDGNLDALALYERHYSCYQYKDGRKRRGNRFVGPGQRIVLLGEDMKALFVWRKFIDDSGQQGVNCAVFRNESEHRSSDLILEAERWAQERWPGVRLYTYVKPSAIRSVNPGYCFKLAGWKSAGKTGKGLIILAKERTP